MRALEQASPGSVKRRRAIESVPGVTVAREIVEVGLGDQHAVFFAAPFTAPPKALITEVVAVGPLA